MKMRYITQKTILVSYCAASRTDNCCDLPAFCEDATA